MADATIYFGPRGSDQVRTRPLTGSAEWAAGSDALALLRELGATDCAGQAVDVDRLTAGDRDRLLAAVYRAEYGTAVVADAVCRACDETFELRFDLALLGAARVPDGSATGDPPSVTVGDARYRLPTVADLAGDPVTLAARLHLDGPAVDEPELAAALEAADPALLVDLRGTCPECATEQATPFSIVSFLSATLARDRPFVLREIHLIARFYRWTMSDILALTRADRQAFVRLILDEAQAAGRSRTTAGSLAS